MAFSIVVQSEGHRIDSISESQEAQKPSRQTPRCNPKLTRPSPKKIAIAYPNSVEIPVITLYHQSISINPPNQRSEKGLTIIENETPKLSITLQSRVSSCLYPRSANRCSSSSSTSCALGRRPGCSIVMVLFDPDGRSGVWVDGRADSCWARYRAFCSHCPYIISLMQCC